MIATLLQNSVLSQGGVLAQGAAAAHGAVLAQAASAPYPAVLSYAALGLTMGMAAAFSPGPLQALVIAESARRGWRAGALVALAPLLSDAVMAPAAVLLAGSLSSGWLRVATAAGAAMLARLGWGAVTGAGRETVAAAGAAADARAGAAGNGAGRAADGPAGGPAAAAAAAPAAVPIATLWRACLVNLLNPHAWLFWGLVGGPTIAAASRVGLAGAVGFVAAFLSALIGGKALIAVLVDRGLARAGGRWRVRVEKAAGLALLAAAAWLAWTALAGAF